MAKQLSTALAHECLFIDFLSKEEHKTVFEALKHPGWVDAMQDELNQFARYKVWTLVLAPSVARLEAIKIFLAFATYMNFIFYQMDLKSAFLNGKLKEEFYVKQPLGFESNEFPNHVCKLDKSLYGLKQAPRACTKLCKQSAKLMTQRYEISMMGILTYFLGFQIKQSERGISINQEKYVKDLLKKYDINGSSVKTLMVPPNNLGPDLSAKAVNETQFRGMIFALMANLSHYGSDALAEAAVQNFNSPAQQDALILSVIEQLKTKINLENKSINDTLTAELERYKEQVKVLKKGQSVDLKSAYNILESCVQSVEIVLSSSNHPTSDIEDAFSSNSPDYVLTSPDYFPASPGNTSSDPSNNSYDLEISPSKDAETPVKSSILVSPSSSVGSSSPVRSITPPPDYPFDESIFAELDNLLWIIPRPLGSKPVPKEPNESDAHLWK
uniref:Reverse transcriptase Ty1/copia-type domain-containing protein n=1 Tax=Tanacetum cinerariifolium TaxID=118510 RepID=A0A6L2K014_TANCI|nr:hypothetical protein [Tanacetum cinerariifolium]